MAKPSLVKIRALFLFYAFLTDEYEMRVYLNFDTPSLLVIIILSENKVLRFNELGKLIPDISSRVLSGTLRTLEADGLVERKVYPTVPPKVEYRLAETGDSLVPLILQLTEWAQKHRKSIIKHREEFERGNDLALIFSCTIG